MQIEMLLAAPPQLEAERVPGGAEALHTLGPEIRGRLVHWQRQTLSQLHGSYAAYDRDMLRMVSLECAAGAPATRCRAWFRHMASVAASPDPASAAVYSSLACDFTRDTAAWPPDIATRETDVRVVYRAFTGRQIDVGDVGSSLFDTREWIAVHSAIAARDTEAATAAFEALARWWLRDYEATETPRFDFEAYPCFETTPNAALALALHRERMPIRFSDPDHELFYLAALM